MNIEQGFFEQLNQQLTKVDIDALRAIDAARSVIEDVRQIRSYLTVVQSDAVRAELAATAARSE